MFTKVDKLINLQILYVNKTLNQQFNKYIYLKDVITLFDYSINQLINEDNS